MLVPARQELPAAFRPHGLAVIGALAALGGVPWAGRLASPLLVHWAAFVVQASIAGWSDLSPRTALREAASLLPIWGRSLVTVLVAWFPFLVLLGVRAASLSYPGAKALGALEEATIALVVVFVPLNAILFPAALTLAVTESDLLYLLSFRRLVARTGTISFAVACGVLGIVALVALSMAIPSAVPAAVAGFVERCAAYALVVFLARSSGLALVQKGFGLPQGPTGAGAAPPFEGAAQP